MIIRVASTVIWICIQFAFTHSFGQTNPIDAIYKKADEQLQAGDPDSALYYYQTAWENDQSTTNYLSLIGMANSYLKKSLYDSVRYYLDLALPLVEEQTDTFSMANIHQSLGVLSQQQGDFDQANKDFIQSVTYWYQVGADSLEAKTFINIAQNYVQLQDPTLQLHYLRRALVSATTHNRPRELAIANMGISGCYQQSGQLDSAKYFLQASNQIATKIQDPILIAYSYVNLAMMSDGAEKKNYFQQAITAEKIPPFDQTRIKYFYAQYLTNANQYLEAEQVIKEVLQACRELNSKDLEHNALKILIDILEKTGRHRDALNLSGEFIAIKDSLFDRDMQQEINRLNIKYESSLKDEKNKILLAESQLKDLEINQLKTQSRIRLLWLVIAGLATAGLLITLSLRQRIHQKNQELLIGENHLQQEKLENLSKEKELTRLQATIAGEEGERKRIAQDLHDGLGGILSTVKLSLSKANGDKKSTINLIDRASGELRRIAKNLLPIHVSKFGLLVALEDLCEEMSSEQLSITFQSLGLTSLQLEPLQLDLYRIFQELIYNAVKHAEATEIIVQLSGLDHFIQGIVEDNGHGQFSRSSDDETHFGLKNIQSRIDKLGGTIDFKSQQQVGTTITFEIPIKP